MLIAEALVRSIIRNDVRRDVIYTTHGDCSSSANRDESLRCNLNWWGR